ncbi:hypothetical protein D3C80_1719750 [compost metagenome]
MGPLVWFTLGATVVTVQQFRHWSRSEQRSEKWVFLGWMIAAWVIGVLLIAGVKFPTPTRPLFPGWK